MQENAGPGVFTDVRKLRVPYVAGRLKLLPGALLSMPGGLLCEPPYSSTGTVKT